MLRRRLDGDVNEHENERREDVEKKLRERRGHGGKAFLYLIG